MKAFRFTLSRMTREQLTAILTATCTDAVHLDNGAYLDWSTRHDNGVTLEAGDADGNAVQIPLTADDLKTLIHRLAATALAA